MFDLFMLIFTLVMLAIGVCVFVSFFEHCTFEEAAFLVWGFFTGKKVYHIKTDDSFYSEIRKCVRNIVGEIRFRELMNLEAASKGDSFLCSGKYNGLDCICITVPMLEEEEKIRIEMQCKSILARFLRIRGFNDRIKVLWSFREDVQLSCIVLIYAERKNDAEMLDRMFAEDANVIIQKNQPLVDDDLENAE